MSQPVKANILSAYFAQLWRTNRWVRVGGFGGEGRGRGAFPNELRIKFPHHSMLAFHGSISHQFIRPLAANGLSNLCLSFSFQQRWRYQSGKAPLDGRGDN